MVFAAAGLAAAAFTVVVVDIVPRRQSFADVSTDGEVDRALGGGVDVDGERPRALGRRSGSTGEILARGATVSAASEGRPRHRRRRQRVLAATGTKKTDEGCDGPGPARWAYWHRAFLRPRLRGQLSGSAVGLAGHGAHRGYTPRT